MRQRTIIIGSLLAVAGTIAGIYIFKNKQNNNGAQSSNGKYLDSDLPINKPFNAKVVADVLYEAMKDMGTDEDMIFEILAPVTPTQFAQVVKTFGVKPYNTLTGNQRYVFKRLPKLGLKTWLKSELSTKQYIILKQRYPKNL